VIAVVAQARMTSSRLPGKVLRPLGEKRTIEYVVERLRRCREAELVVIATSSDPSDNPVAELCEELGVEVHRGPLEDVAGRFLEVVERFALDAFVRVTADSPLLDQRLVDYGVELFRSGDWDVVTNVFPSTFASGQSLEVVSADAFRRAYGEMTEPEEREHVTLHLYRHPDDFTIRNFVSGRDEGGLDMSLDTEEDARLIEAIFARMDRPHWEYDYDQVMELYRAATGAEAR
jgi:spore coat polysaccharide biosynthesis protein SpsF